MVEIEGIEIYPNWQNRFHRKRKRMGLLSIEEVEELPLSKRLEAIKKVQELSSKKDNIELLIILLGVCVKGGKKVIERLSVDHAQTLIAMIEEEIAGFTSGIGNHQSSGGALSSIKKDKSQGLWSAPVKKPKKKKKPKKPKKVDRWDLI